MKDCKPRIYHAVGDVLWGQVRNIVTVSLGQLWGNFVASSGQSRGSLRQVGATWGNPGQTGAIHYFLFFCRDYSPTRLALGVLTCLEELVAEAGTPRFRGEGAEQLALKNRWLRPGPPGSAARVLSSLLGSLGSARFPQDFPLEGSARFREGSARLPGQRFRKVP